MEWFLDECEFERKEIDHDDPIVIKPGIEELKFRGKKEEEDAVYLYKVVKDTELFRIDMVWGIIPEEEVEDEEEFKREFGRWLGNRGSHVINGYITDMGFEPLPGLLQDEKYMEDVAEGSEEVRTKVEENESEN